MPGTIIFNGIYVNAQATNAAVFIGEAAAPGWDSHNKNQMSIGTIFNAFGGGGPIAGNLNLLSDNDFLDTLILDGFERDGGPSIQS
ncbi:hypothetical protein [Paenibacillus flagellatus]|uniref:Uncharacterized protein n=1 Tax=Paenibacillus flagellatus TaxID=2211139 RepID=A0A2V5K9D0_9BACL|nr:hypothetical protein [Paenibacillus flagellatus]PYI55452.1 hypothetical protein DLM86_06870 [Paenibacillus flagellatus]